MTQNSSNSSCEIFRSNTGNSWWACLQNLTVHSLLNSCRCSLLGHIRRKNPPTSNHFFCLLHCFHSCFTTWCDILLLTGAMFVFCSVWDSEIVSFSEPWETVDDSWNLSQVLASLFCTLPFTKLCCRESSAIRLWGLTWFLFLEVLPYLFVLFLPHLGLFCTFCILWG